MTGYEMLEQRFRQIAKLKEVGAIVGWDEAVNMPEGAGPYRNQAMAELGVVVQQLASAPEVKDQLARAEGEVNRLNAWQRANLREIRRQYNELAAVPQELNHKLAVAKMNCEQQWRKLRAQNNWTEFKGPLTEVLGLTREALKYLSEIYGTSLYDTALNLYSPGLNQRTVSKLFAEIRAEFPSLLSAVKVKQGAEKVIVPKGEFPMKAQKALGQELMAAVGFSMHNGRLDESHHPFCGGTPRDVRITTRYNSHEFLSSLMGVLHESGHGIYEQNLPEEWLDQPVGAAMGMSIHESQSLMMEMQVCRSREFIRFAHHYIVKHIGPFVENPESLDVENLCRLVTRVRPGLIRVDADEVTYPAHIILRFEIERELVEGRMEVGALPEVWDGKMKELLGLSTLGDDRDGCMQDVHWPSGTFGYFPAYTFGAVIAAQLFAAAEIAVPDARERISHGDLKPLHGWLRENIWSQGSLVNTLELVEKASGPLGAASFLKHLRARYT